MVLSFPWLFPNTLLEKTTVYQYMYNVLCGNHVLYTLLQVPKKKKPYVNLQYCLCSQHIVMTHKDFFLQNKHNP